MSLWPSTLAAFRETLTNEGNVPWMYLDDRGLVTTGQGNLIDGSLEGASDPAYAATLLDWHNPDGSKTSEADIRTAWQLVKSRQDLKVDGGASPVFRDLTSIRLSEEAIASLVATTANSIAASLEAQLPAIISFPADAQLALLRWGYANGPNALKSGWPRLYKALTAPLPDFDTASQESEWVNENLDVKVLMNHLWQNASHVIAQNLDPSVLVWPGTVPEPDAPSASGNGSGSGLVTTVLVAGALIAGVVYMGYRRSKAMPSPAEPSDNPSPETPS
jgi:hypothetical protein